MHFCTSRAQMQKVSKSWNFALFDPLGLLEASGDPPGCSPARLGCSWTALWLRRASPRHLLGLLGRLLGSFWQLLEPSWGYFGRSWRPLGALWQPLWRYVKLSKNRVFYVVLAPPGPLRGCQKGSVEAPEAQVGVHTSQVALHRPLWTPC